MSEHDARWLDHADPSLREALQIARTQAPSSAQVHAIADGVAHALAQGTAAASAAAIAHKTAWGKLTTVALAGSIALAGAAWKLQRAPGQAVPARSEAAVAVAVDAGPRASSTAFKARVAPIRQASTRSSEAPSVAASPAVGAPMARDAAQTAKTAPSHSVLTKAERRAHSFARTRTREPTADELALLQEAQHALLVQPTRTLALIARLRSMSPHGAFEEEREVLSLDALQRLHRTEQLRDDAAVFLERYPASLHRDRVQRLLEVSAD